VDLHADRQTIGHTRRHGERRQAEQSRRRDELQHARDEVDTAIKVGSASTTRPR
jgi:hypothetical protein